MKIFISRDGERTGPYSVKEINARLKDGTLLPSDLACQEGMEEWVPLSEMEFSGSHENSSESFKAQETKSVNTRIGFRRLVFTAKSIVVAFGFSILAHLAWQPLVNAPAVDNDKKAWNDSIYIEFPEDLVEDVLLDFEYISIFVIGLLISIIATHITVRMQRKKNASGKNNPQTIFTRKLFILPVVLIVVFGFYKKEYRLIDDYIPETPWYLAFMIFGAGIGVWRARAWYKGAIQQQNFDQPIMSPTQKTRLIRLAWILALLILVLDIRNASRRFQRETNRDFLIAAEKGNIEAVRHSISDGADIEVKYWYEGYKSHRDEGFEAREGLNALHVASSRGHTKIVEILLKNGADVNERESVDDYEAPTTGTTAILSASARGHKDIVQMLLANGADANELHTFDGRKRDNELTGYPLSYAIGGGHTDVVRVLIERGAKVNATIDENDDRSITPLHLAARGGFPVIVQLLIAEGARVNARTAKGRSPLHWAVADEKFELSTVKQLLSKGAEINVTDQYGATPLHLALINRRPAVLKHLSDSIEEARKMAKSKRQERLLAELQAEFDHDLNKLEELNALVEFLLAQKAEVNAQLQGGNETPLDLAMKSELTEIVELLRKHGAKTIEELDLN